MKKIMHFYYLPLLQRISYEAQTQTSPYNAETLL